MLALRAAQILNLSEVSRDAGVPEATARKWLSVLQSTYVIKLLQPFHENLSKRLVKSPKVIFLDTGMLCYLLGIQGGEEWDKSPLRGALFENMVVAETLKQLSFQSHRWECFFLRTHEGGGIDFLLQSGSVRHVFEIKASHTPRLEDAKHLIAFREALSWTSATVLTQQRQSMPLGHQVVARHWIEALNGL